MSDEPRTYEVTLKLEIYVTYGVEAYGEDDAETEAMKDALIDLPRGWDITAAELIEADCPALHDMGDWKDD